MLPEKSYEVIFVTRNSFPPIERYEYLNRCDAENHFNLFFTAESENLYKCIVLYEINWKDDSKDLLGLLTFAEILDNGDVIRKDWRNWNIGRETVWEAHEFDGSAIYRGTITAKYEDHAIMETERMRLWIDDDTLYMFR